MSAKQNKTKQAETIAPVAEPQKPVEIGVTAKEINEEMDREYGWIGNDLTHISRAILRELVIARLERSKACLTIQKNP